MDALSASINPGKTVVSLLPHRTAALPGNEVTTVVALFQRINNRIDNNFGFEGHFIRGKNNMTARVGLALAVMMA